MSQSVFPTPPLWDDERRVIDAIDALRRELEVQVRSPRRWVGRLRRQTLARAVQGSNSIEGYVASLDDVLAVEGGEEPLDASTETQLALTGYREAMTYVLQLAKDDTVETVDEGLLKSLHFMMTKHDLSKNPGRWRPGPIFIHREFTGEQVYEGPVREAVPPLIRNMLERLDGDDAPVLVRAAMAHLNLVMIHPFSDGNGRMGRALQTLVLARDTIVAPVFSSIEEYLGRNTAAYYDVLAQVGGGSWNPDNDARPWVRFCLVAHYRQARTLLRRIEATENLWRACAEVAERHGLPERTLAALLDAAQGLRLRRAGYIATVAVTDGAQITPQTASRDLKELVDSGLLVPSGERRGRIYFGSDELKGIWQGVRASRAPRSNEDPFQLAFDQLEFDAGA
jgi:Fic family protein